MTATHDSVLTPTLSSRYYTDSAVFDAENERIFEQQWCYVGRADELRAAGLTAQPVGEVEITVTCNDDGAAVFRQAEQLIMDVGDAFVPIKHDGVIYIRPPVG